MSGKRPSSARSRSRSVESTEPDIWCISRERRGPGLPGDRSTTTWRSRQDGLHLLSQGAYAGIRNVVVHSHEPQWSEQEALEYLAVLSTVARWTDETEVHNC